MKPELYPCARCGRIDQRRMVALMTTWFGAFVELPPDHGYFYLCPRCYSEFIVPHSEQIIHRLVDQHPFLHRTSPAQHFNVDRDRSSAAEPPSAA